MDDMEERCSSNHEYKILGLALLLRLLFMDQNSLLRAVCKRRGYKPRFMVGDVFDLENRFDRIGKGGHTQLGLYADMLVPRYVQHSMNCLYLTHRQFLRHPVAVINNIEYIRVGEIIDFMAHERGGVHIDPNIAYKKSPLSHMDQMRLGGLTPTLRSLTPIATVAIQSLSDLKELISTNLHTRQRFMDWDGNIPTELRLAHFKDLCAQVPYCTATIIDATNFCLTNNLTGQAVRLARAALRVDRIHPGANELLACMHFNRAEFRVALHYAEYACKNRNYASPQIKYLLALCLGILEVDIQRSLDVLDELLGINDPAFFTQHRFDLCTIDDVAKYEPETLNRFDDIQQQWRSKVLPPRQSRQTYCLLLPDRATQLSG